MKGKKLRGLKDTLFLSVFLLLFSLYSLIILFYFFFVISSCFIHSFFLCCSFFFLSFLLSFPSLFYYFLIAEISIFCCLIHELYFHYHSHSLLSICEPFLNFFWKRFFIFSKSQFQNIIHDLTYPKGFFPLFSRTTEKKKSEQKNLKVSFVVFLRKSRTQNKEKKEKRESEKMRSRKLTISLIIFSVNWGFPLIFFFSYKFSNLCMFSELHVNTKYYRIIRFVGKTKY